ncbi:MAG: UpxY family transcription antiterminator [Saprospiraceae bacterium]|nr:UpxY family transcription antiterminator [Saprospiraceae bacterium]
MIPAPDSMTVAEKNRRHMHDSEARWFAIYTPYKREKSAIKMLRQKGIECYVPLVEKVRRYQRKVKSFQVPLMNNYIFVRITRSQYIDVLEVRDVSWFVRLSDEIIAVPQEEIDLLKRVAGETGKVYSHHERPKVGQNVEIIGGKLTGLSGVVRQDLGKNQVLIDLDTLGWSLQLEVHPKYLQPVN